MRRQRVVFLALCSPFLLSAQQSTGAASSPASNGVARTFLSYGTPHGGWLLMAFDSIPASQYGFRPTPAQQSVGHIAQHLEDANYGQCSIFGPVKHVKLAKDSLADTIKAKWPKDTLINRVLLRPLCLDQDDVGQPVTNFRMFSA